jgi:hypothetical protein
MVTSTSETSRIPNCFCQEVRRALDSMNAAMFLTLCIPPGDVCENPLVFGKVPVPDRSSERLMDTPSSFFPRMLCRAFNLYASALARRDRGYERKKPTWQGKN